MTPTPFDRELEAKNRMEKISWLVDRYRYAREIGYTLTDESLEAMHAMEIELRRVIFKLKTPTEAPGETPGGGPPKQGLSS